MKKILLALLVLTIAVPAMGVVTITMRKGTEKNAVIVGYDSGGAEVRAFALNVSVSDGAYIVGSATRSPVSNNYYVTPTNITFKVVGGNTDINTLGLPVVAETVNGCIIEVASLYVGGPNAPPSTGDLVKFLVDCTKGGADYKINVTIPSVNTQRGGVVLKDGSSVAPTLPAQLNIICADCWLCARQPKGDATGDGITDASDLLKLRQSWLKLPGAGYNCCADFTQDGVVDASDLLKLRQNWLGSGASCAVITCP